MKDFTLVFNPDKPDITSAILRTLAAIEFPAGCLRLHRDFIQEKSHKLRYLYIRDGKIDGFDSKPAEELSWHQEPWRDFYKCTEIMIDVSEWLPEIEHTVSFDGGRPVKISHKSYLALKEGLK